MSLKEYEYKCLVCKKRLSQPATIPAPTKCRFCGGKMAKVFGTNNIIYKGYEFVGPAHQEKRDR